MIGDTFYDIEGARENHLPAIGVSYGYGSREELEKPALMLSFLLPKSFLPCFFLKKDLSENDFHFLTGLF